MKFGINSMMWASPFRDAEAMFAKAKSYGADVFEIAKAASVWRPFAKTPESIAEEGLPFLREVFERR